MYVVCVCIHVCVHVQVYLMYLLHVSTGVYVCVWLGGLVCVFSKWLLVPLLCACLYWCTDLCNVQYIACTYIYARLVACAYFLTAMFLSSSPSRL